MSSSARMAAWVYDKFGNTSRPGRAVTPPDGACRGPFAFTYNIRSLSPVSTGGSGYDMAYMSIWG